MSKTRKTYPAKFKAEATSVALREDASAAELSSRYSVPAKVIHRWKEEAFASMKAGFCGKQESPA